MFGGGGAACCVVAGGLGRMELVSCCSKEYTSLACSESVLETVCSLKQHPF